MRELCEDWEPDGHTEIHLVEQIGLAEWRLRRVRRAELGEIRKQMASSMASHVEAEIERTFEHFPERLPKILRESTAGLSYLWRAVEDALDELESEGEVSEVSIEDLEALFGTETESPTTKLRIWFVEEMPEGNEEASDRDGEPTPTADNGEPDKKAAARKHLEMTLNDLDRQGRKQHK